MRWKGQLFRRCRLFDIPNLVVVLLSTKVMARTVDWQNPPHTGQTIEKK
jgi:hypothetical protein